jgi:hypothetical protein
MKNMIDLINSFDLDSQITLEDIPQIDLYMDQVIQLFENTFNSAKRNEDEKVLTKTMINNYAKGKLFFPVKNKKYSKEHLILISLIYQLKGGLSISDIKETLAGINEKIESGSINLDQFYESYLHLAEKNTASFKKDVIAKAEDTKKEIKSSEVSKTEELEKVLMIASFIHMSNLYRRAAERLVDEIGEKGAK